MDKLLIPCIYLKEGRAVSGFQSDQSAWEADPCLLAAAYGNSGADEILVFDLSSNDKEQEEAVGMIKRICQAAGVPVIGAGNVRRMEDVKKLLYAGCARALLNFGKQGNADLLEEVSKKFGKDKMLVYLPTPEIYQVNREVIDELAGTILCNRETAKALGGLISLPILLMTEKEAESVPELLAPREIQALTGAAVSYKNADLMAVKQSCKSQGIPVNTFESKIPWEDFKLNRDGLIPCIVQDYQTDEVLMLAYMNQEAFQNTLNTGRMTYWSRSRQELWVKGLTSGHFQYVKSLTLDCDNDTLLAKVAQVGPACHTGNPSCFFQELMKKEYDDTNPLRVFEKVFDVIKDRKVHPREGSYTNYLFDKGIDKILKKVGEECTEIVIAAKNPDKEEIKYEISDFLYHVMVLMAEKDVTWQEITRELARR